MKGNEWDKPSSLPIIQPSKQDFLFAYSDGIFGDLAGGAYDSDYRSLTCWTEGFISSGSYYFCEIFYQCRCLHYLLMFSFP